MSRSAEFRKEVGVLLEWTKGLHGVLRATFQILALAGIGGSVLGSLLTGNPWLFCYLTIPAIIYLTAVFAIAGERTKGPLIATELRQPDANKTFHLVVRNDGRGTAICRVWLADVTDGQDNPTGEITSEAEIYWSETLELMRLFGRKQGLAAILTVYADKLRVNTIVNVEQNVRGVVSVQRAKGQMFVGESGQREKEVRLTVRITFYKNDEKGDELTDKVLRFAVKPNPVQYEMIQIS